MKLKLLELDIPPISGCESLIRGGLQLANFPARNLPKPSQPWCEHYLVWAITSWWCDQVSALHPIQGQCHPVLPHRAGTNFTPWYGETVTFGNTAQCFHPFPGIEPSSPTWQHLTLTITLRGWHKCTYNTAVNEKYPLCIEIIVLLTFVMPWRY